MNDEELERCYGEQLCHCDNSLDNSFKRLIEAQELTWLPWVGAEWLTSERRILVVSESHYAALRNAPNTQARLEEWKSDKDGTREVFFEEVLIDGGRRNPLFINLHRALFGMGIDVNGRKNLWRHLAFCNFIQRPMSNPGERPGPNEFRSGWQPFIKLLTVLRPDMCLFVGVSAAKPFNNAMSAMAIEHQWHTDDSVRRTFPVRFSVTLAGQIIRMVAIRHASQYFSWRAWHDYLNHTIPDELAFMRHVVFGLNPDPAV